MIKNLPKPKKLPEQRSACSVHFPCLVYSSVELAVFGCVEVRVYTSVVLRIRSSVNLGVFSSVESLVYINALLKVYSGVRLRVYSSVQ